MLDTPERLSLSLASKPFKHRVLTFLNFSISSQPFLTAHSPFVSLSFPHPPQPHACVPIHKHTKSYYILQLFKYFLWPTLRGKVYIQFGYKIILLKIYLYICFYLQAVSQSCIQECAPPDPEIKVIQNSLKLSPNARGSIIITPFYWLIF